MKLTDMPVVGSKSRMRAMLVSWSVTVFVDDDADMDALSDRLADYGMTDRIQSTVDAAVNSIDELRDAGAAVFAYQQE